MDLLRTNEPGHQCRRLRQLLVDETDRAVPHSFEVSALVDHAWREGLDGGVSFPIRAVPGLLERLHLVLSSTRDSRQDALLDIGLARDPARFQFLEAVAEVERGDVERAESLLLDAHRQVGARVLWRARIELVLADVFSRTGQHERALMLLPAIGRRGPEGLRPLAMLRLGEVLLRSGESAFAFAVNRRARSLFAHAGDPRGTLATDEALAEVLAARRSPALAVEMMEAVIAERTRRLDVTRLGASYDRLARLAADDPERRRRALAMAVAAHRDGSRWIALALALGELADACARTGHVEESVAASNAGWNVARAIGDRALECDMLAAYVARSRADARYGRAASAPARRRLAHLTSDRPTTRGHDLARPPVDAPSPEPGSRALVATPRDKAALAELVPADPFGDAALTDRLDGWPARRFGIPEEHVREFLRTHRGDAFRASDVIDEFLVGSGAAVRIVRWLARRGVVESADGEDLDGRRDARVIVAYHRARTSRSVEPIDGA